MKHEIFISYSDFDKEKVDLIINELEGHKTFTPLVIASNKEALKPLAKKVAEGIISSTILLPILTEKSIVTQWINQEIGFATALDKKIMPIVDINLIDRLKGFIHKQIDLPYNFQPNENKAQEHKDFIKQFRALLSDLEQEFQSLDTKDVIPEKTEFEKSLEIADKMNIELEFKQKRSAYLNSPDALNAAKTEVLNMFSDIEKKNKTLQDKNFHFDFEKEVYNPSFIFKSDGYSISITWRTQYDNTLKGALLYVKKWRGYLTKNSSVISFPEEQPEMLYDTKYTFDIDRQDTALWCNQSDNELYKSDQIIDDSFTWIIEQIAKKRLNN